MEPQSGDPRIRFAAERTLLAWIRTGLALMGFGFVVARFGIFLREIAAVDALPKRHGRWSVFFGTVLVLAGVLVNVAAAVSHWRMIARLERGETVLRGRWSLSVIVALAMAVVGAAMAAYLFWTSG